MRCHALRARCSGTCLYNEVIAWPQKCHKSAADCGHATGGDNSILCTFKQGHLRSKSLHRKTPSPYRSCTHFITIWKPEAESLLH